MTNLITKALLFVTIFTIFLSPFSIVQKQNSVTNSITIQPNISYAQEEIDIDDAGFLDCSQFDFACKGINFLQIIFVTGGNVLVGISAFFMDTFLFHSLQSSSYSDSGFIVQGWEILRDMSNIIFIFALLSLAFQLVLDMGTANAKKRFVRVIVVALGINFSLFFSFAVIDASNLLAYTFYNKIDQQEVVYDASSVGVSQDGNKISTGGTEEEFIGKSTSLAIAAKINPQRLLNADIVSDGKVSRGQRVVMVLMAGVINGVLIYVFLSVAFMFLGRTIALWLTVVLAPLAFASLIIPGWENKKYFGFNNWINSLFKTSFMAAVFLFFLYLAVQFMKIDIVFAGSGSGPFINNILNIIIPMAAIVVLLLTAKKVANAMSGDFAGTISGIVTKVAGGAVAVGSIAATGGAALAGGALRGVGAAAATSSNATLSKIGNKTRNMGRGLQSTNFNFAQTGVGKFASKTTGIDMGEKMGNISYMKAENKAFLGAAKLKESGKDLLAGRGTKEMEAEYQKEKTKIKTESGKWQESLIDTKSAESIKAEEKTIMKQESNSSDPRSKDATGSPLSNEDFIQALHNEFSKGLTVAVNNNGTPVAVPKTYPDVNNGQPLFLTKDGTQGGEPVSRVEFENSQIKRFEAMVKEKQEAVKNERATGGNIAKATAALKAQETELEKFKDQTATAGKAKAEKIQTNIRGQAREKVAQNIEKEATTTSSKTKKVQLQKAANRTRIGKVKVDDDGNPGVKEVKK